MRGFDVDDVLDPLRAIERLGHSRYQVFRDWVDLMLYALQREDEPYLEILERYDTDRQEGERAADHFSKAFAELLAACEATSREQLGVVYEEYGMQNEHFGQHFTPHNVCDAKAEMLAVAKDDVNPPITIHDPACGSGRLLLAAARAHDEPTFVAGTDKDSTCAKMAALNGCLFNVDGVFVHGNSLTLEQYRAWRTRHTILGGEAAEVDPDSVPLPEGAFEDEEPPTESEDVETGDRISVDPDAVEQADLEAWTG